MAPATRFHVRPRPGRPAGAWRSVLFAPIGDGQTRRRGSDAVKVGVAVLATLVLWRVVRADSAAERSILHALTPAPDGVRWLVTTLWWVGTVGLVVALAGVALLSRRWPVIRDPLLAGGGAWIVVKLLQVGFGATGGRPPVPVFPGVNVGFPIATLAATVGFATAALPYLARWLQVTIEVAIALVSVVAVVHGSGLPVPVLASVAVGWGASAAVHLVFGSPLGLPSGDEAAALLVDLGLAAADVRPRARQEWGVARFTGRIEDDGPVRVDVSIYGRDASQARLLSKVFRFLFYRDSGPAVAFTRRQQVEHEAYLTLMAGRAGARVPDVIVAGPSGASRDAVLVTRPPVGHALASFRRYTPAEDGAGGDGDATAAPAPPVDPDAPVADDGVLDALFAQVALLAAAGIAHGGVSPDTVVVGGAGSVGLVDFRDASTAADAVQIQRDAAAALATAALVAGPERAARAASRTLGRDALVAALPFVQRTALNNAVAHDLRGHKQLLRDVREQAAAAVGVEVPKLIEPRRVSWVNLAMVAGTLIGGWALLGVLINVTHSWGTIKGANLAWVAVVFVLAQAAYPAIAVTTVGSVTEPVPFGQAWALEMSDTFVALAGGSMAVLGTRVRFFQKQGFDSTLAVSSGVLVSTASWIVKGALFLIALPIAFHNFNFVSSPTGDQGYGHLVWFVILIVLAVTLLVGAVLFVPRLRRLAGNKLRPKLSEIWSHLRVLATHPRNLFQIFGGSIAAQVLVALALGAALHAFGARLGLATLVVALTLASMLGGISPTPGGMGVVEAGMILCLTAAGVSQTDAVAATFVQRLFTSYLPPIWGWFTMVWMRKRDYL